METYQFKGLLTNEGWLDDAFITVNDKGIITAISQQFTGKANKLNVYAIPGFQNAHSHAFQYAMAGLAEIHSTDRTPDDFWSWREAMYQLALSISPDHLQAIAQQLYSEMLRHGYTNVAEFHYVHHDKDGKPYANISEMGERLVAAASTVGIGITLVPIFYQKGGFGKNPTEGQKRFISATIEDYYTLLEASEKSCSYYSHANVGIGIHSMRGVEPTDIVKVAEQGRQDVPFHIHIAEQLKEIEDCLDYLGKRPVEWLLDTVNLNDRFHLVHATHLTKQETQLLADSRANVVLCPSTEGNLGDGIFPLRDFISMNGAWSIGTDSHIGLNPFEELRILDYGQRLTSHKRNTYYTQEEGDAGKFAINQSLIAGRKAMGNNESIYFKIGEPLDAVLMDASSALIQTSKEANLASTFVYSTDVSMQYGTISKGKLVVKEGKHFLANSTSAKFVKAITQLGNR
ncbi:formimidoylglutamate deiminase [Paracrocinitomix mangrovi]|uniref:formimidoylglutamate deiminase n=1 Tax=Paracrocinitomix mangrovi TaxID=2862509 RepID=UPI001C8D7991|nr:formimidoylglutamate deiminase [Paracrocinitomix mangrovi]UKN02642.1 formimidoylglutamate deiminase [Paracrocinitomix mangrovi]